jgi:copper chaperone CopZ
MNESMNKTAITYKISGLTCKNCANKVTHALKPYAQSIDVTLDPQQITLTGASAGASELNAVLKNIGNYVIGAEISAPTISANADLKIQNSNDQTEQVAFFVIYKPLLLVFGYILLACFAVEYANGSFELHRFMPNFMAGFFLVFSFFKLLDLRGFASSYSMYDIAAKKIPAYGFIYPLIELGLGTAYLLGYRPMLVNAITLFVMAFSSIGVILAVMNKQKIKCPCLGTGFNLPMTTVTIIEDLLMASMALWMLT